MVSNFEDEEGHYVSILTPEGPQFKYMKNSPSTSSKRVAVDQLFFIYLNFPLVPHKQYFCPSNEQFGSGHLMPSALVLKM